MEVCPTGGKRGMQVLRTEERLNAELKHGHYDNFFDSEEEWLEYELEQLRKYITDYIKGRGHTSVRPLPYQNIYPALGNFRKY